MTDVEVKAVAASTRDSTAPPLARRLLLIVLVIAAPVWATAGARASTDVAGIIESNTTWGPDGSPYVLTGDVTVAAGVTLTLAPGAVVKASSKFQELIVLGRLEAQGTLDNPVVLTSYKDDTAGGDSNGDGSATAPAFGDWVGVGFYSNKSNGMEAFVEIRYAGYFSESAGSTDVETRVRAACGGCHLFPEPEILPRELWKNQIARMAALVDYLPPEPGKPATGFSLKEVTEWYESEAPESFSLPVALTRDGPGPVRFRKRAVKLGSSGSPAVAAVQPLEEGQFGDRDFILAVPNLKNGSIHLLSRSSGPIRVGEAGYPMHIVAGDLNGDQLADLIVSDLGDPSPSEELVGRVVVGLNAPDGNFTFTTVADGIGRVTDARAMDLDGDGDLDIVVAAFGGLRNGGVYVLYNESSPNAPLNFRMKQVSARAGAVSVVPFGGPQPDSRPGFAVAFSQHHELVSAFYPKGKGYEERVLYRAPHANWGISNLETADLDGDSDMDFLLSHGDTFGDGFAYKPYHGVSWLENRGSSGFESHFIGALYGAHRAEAADLDGDGDLDVVASGFLPQIPLPISKNQIRVDSVIWFEHTDEEWIPWLIESNHPRHTGLTVIDMDEDGRPDIVGPINNAWERRDHKGDPAMEVWFNLGSR